MGFKKICGCGLCILKMNEHLFLLLTAFWIEPVEPLWEYRYAARDESSKDTQAARPV